MLLQSLLCFTLPHDYHTTIYKRLYDIITQVQHHYTKQHSTAVQCCAVCKINGCNVGTVACVRSVYEGSAKLPLVALAIPRASKIHRMPWNKYGG